MPDEFVDCPNCGRQNPIGNYCAHCGKSINHGLPTNSSSDNQKHKGPNLSDSSIHNDHIEFGFEIEGMDKHWQDLLFASAELDVLNKHLNDLISRIQSTRQALQLPSSDKEILAKRTKKLQRELKEIKARRAHLSGRLGQLDLARTLNALNNEEDKLEKLHEKKNSLEKSIFREEETAITENITSLKKKMDNEVKLAKKWIKGMREKLKALRKELTRLEAKLKIGDVSVATYDSRRNEIDRKIEIIEGGMNYLDKLLHSAKKY